MELFCEGFPCECNHGKLTLSISKYRSILAGNLQMKLPEEGQQRRADE